MRTELMYIPDDADYETEADRISDAGDYIDFAYDSIQADIMKFKHGGFVIILDAQYPTPTRQSYIYKGKGIGKKGGRGWTYYPAYATVYKTRREANLALSKLKRNNPRIIEV